MSRLKSFDYKSPFYYMVTLKRLPNRAPFSEIGPEKACGNAIYKAGGKLIMLCPECFGPRWHPTREKELLCAAGRMPFLSLYDARASQPTRKELYTRCHEMIDLTVAGLTPQSPVV